MGRSAPIHHLTNIDLEQRKAICSVCGPTQIYIAKGRTPNTIRTYCMTRIRNSNQAQTLRRSIQNRLQNPNWKPRHTLSKVNTEKMVAICSVCGKTDIRKKKGVQGTIYICATKKREYARKYRNSHYVSRPRQPRWYGHSLSEIDDKNKTAVCWTCGTVRIYVSRVHDKLVRRCSNASQKHTMQAQQRKKEFIHEYMARHGCKRCGYNANPLVLELHRRNPKEEDDKIYRLAMLSYKRLLKELKKSDVLCRNCHVLVHYELGL